MSRLWSDGEEREDDILAGRAQEAADLGYEPYATIRNGRTTMFECPAHGMFIEVAHLGGQCPTCVTDDDRQRARGIDYSHFPTRRTNAT